MNGSQRNPTPAFHHLIAINLPAPERANPITARIRLVAGGALISLGQAIGSNQGRPTTQPH